jgi:DNA mismatch repair ATPase MutS
LSFNPSYREFSLEYQKFKIVVQQLSILDCLFSLAQCSKANNYVKPTFVSGKQQVKIPII